MPVSISTSRTMPPMLLVPLFSPFTDQCEQAISNLGNRVEFPCGRANIMISDRI